MMNKICPREPDDAMMSKAITAFEWLSIETTGDVRKTVRAVWQVLFDAASAAPPPVADALDDARLDARLREQEELIAAYKVALGPCDYPTCGAPCPRSCYTGFPNERADQWKIRERERCQAELTALRAQVAAANTERDAALKDAERYRWLRADPLNIVRTYRFGESEVPTGDELTSRIDAALAAAQEGAQADQEGGR